MSRVIGVARASVAAAAGVSSRKTCRMPFARVAEMEADLEPEAEAAQLRQRHRELDRRAGEHADRVAVELLVAAQHLVTGDEAAEDHEVPDERAERRDRE